MTRFTFVATAMTLTGVFAAPAFAVRPCPPDTNCTGQVDVDDLLAVITHWGPGGGGTSADVDNSGSVNVDDLLQVITHWGPCHFNFGRQFANAEAHQIGLEMLGAGGPLTLPQAQYDRIVRDLGLIRTARPALTTQTHSPAWVPNDFIIGLNSGVPEVQLPCLNTYYQATSTPLGTLRIITTPSKVNVPALCAIYDAAPEVSFAEPDGYIGGENFWVPTDMGGGTWRWNIDDGFTDCFDGCDCHRYYVFDVNAAGVVTMVGCTETGAPWCDFGPPGCP